MRKILAILCAFILVGGAWAITITITGSWTKIIDETDLQGPPGSDLTYSYESSTNEIIIDIGNCGSKDSWGVDVKKLDGNWHSNFYLYVKRTSDGSGAPGSKTLGGTSYQEVTDIDQAFFTGKGIRTGIAVQLKLDGVSVQIPIDTYTTTIYYTVILQ